MSMGGRYSWKFCVHALVATIAFGSATVAGQRDASAQKYVTGFDEFNADPTDWSPWHSGVAGVTVKNYALAWSPGRAAMLYLNTGGTPGSDFALIDKIFTLHSDHGGVIMCEASAAIQAPIRAVSGAIQLIDADSWTYLSSTPFQHTGPSSDWHDEWTSFLGDCPRSLDVRIVLNRTATSATRVWVDDVYVEWYYDH